MADAVLGSIYAMSDLKVLFGSESRCTGAQYGADEVEVRSGTRLVDTVALSTG